jgi:CheY-like chemotaxis protein
MGIVKTHNGAIDVQSTQGRGSAFKVYLPLSTLEQAKPAHIEIATPMGSQERILIIDDEPFFLEVVQELLVSLDYTVTAEQSSQSALHLVHQNPTAFDLVVTDQTMPEMTGVQLVTEIRRVNQEVPIILCTGFSEEINEQTAQHYGVSKFLQKPITRQQLAVAVHGLLSSGAQTANPA